MIQRCRFPLEDCGLLENLSQFLRHLWPEEGVKGIEEHRQEEVQNEYSNKGVHKSLGGSSPHPSGPRLALESSMTREQG